MTTAHPTGILLINLGTPDSPSVRDVRKYLREFLSDERVIDLPAPVRQLLLNCLILPFRSRQSAHAYRQIWTAEGSPLLKHSQDLAAKLADGLGSSYQVALGMRYGNPSIKHAVEQLTHASCQRIIVLPLFPQYSSAATGSAIEAALRELQKGWNIPNITVISDFHCHPTFIDAMAHHIQQQCDLSKLDHLLFSYHGIPERHIDKSGCQRFESCLQGASCPDNQQNVFCYRKQCYGTTRAICRQLALTEARYSVAFQSRLGRTPWIKPYTDEVLPQLAKQGVRKLAIVCPSFVADCLETIEEIGMRANEQWLQLTNEPLQTITCLNAVDYWVTGLQRLIQNADQPQEVAC